MPEAVLQRCKAWREKNSDLLENEGIDLSELSLGWSHTLQQNFVFIMYVSHVAVYILTFIV